MTMGPGSGPSPDGDDATFADVLNGFTLDSGRGRRKRRKAKDANNSEADAAATNQPEQPGRQEYPEYPAVPEPGDAVPGHPEPGQGSGYFESTGPEHYESGYRSGYYDADQGPPGYQEQGSGYFDPPQSSGYFEPTRGTSFGTGFFEPAVSNSGPALPERPGPAPPDEETAAVRPYALTGGRTRASYALELETLISTKESVAARAGANMQFEQRQIVEECRAPRSVAEIAALLRVPVGVARVLISDTADAGLITVHKTVSGSDNAEAHFMLMERVLSGLRRL